MPEYPLIVFATARPTVPLVALRDVLFVEGAPASFAVEIAGEATDEQMNDPEWEAAFLRWMEPDVHEVALIDRMVRGADEEAEALIAAHARVIASSDDTAGRMIVADYLARATAVYAVQILPALLAEDGHEAWGAMDVLLRFLAHATDGLIYVDAEGYCDSDGELLLAETDDLNPLGSDDLG